MQYVYLAVYEGWHSLNRLGDAGCPVDIGQQCQAPEILEWGRAIHCQFPDTEDGLDDGVYTAVVHDGCSDEVLGAIEFELVGSKRSLTVQRNSPF